MSDKPRLRPLTERDIETLGDLRAATDNYIRLDNYRDGWVMPMDCGGWNGSHHSYTLHKLAKRGLCDRMKLGGPHEKGSCRYRINAAGRRLLQRRKRMPICEKCGRNTRAPLFDGCMLRACPRGFKPCL